MVNWISGGSSGGTSSTFTNTCPNTSSSIFPSTTLIWNTWTTSNTSTSTCGNTIWSNWIVVDDPQITPAVPYQPSEQELAARRVAADVAVKRKDANAKAMAILNENLTELQRAALKKHGWFLVEGGKSKKLYRIKSHSYAGNVRELCAEGKRELVQYCCHADGSIPIGDQLLTQLLALRHDEDHFLQRANRIALVA